MLLDVLGGVMTSFPFRRWYDLLTASVQFSKSILPYSRASNSPDSQSLIIQGEESCICWLLVRCLLQKQFKFFRSPEVHFVGVVFPDGSGFAAWIVFQIVIADGIVYNGRKLVIYGAEIRCGIRVPFIVTVGNQAVLPFADMCRGDF